LYPRRLGEETEQKNIDRPRRGGGGVGGKKKGETLREFRYDREGTWKSEQPNKEENHTHRVRMREGRTGSAAYLREKKNKQRRTRERDNIRNQLGSSQKTRRKKLFEGVAADVTGATEKASH